jgi:hypothetical protein
VEHTGAEDETAGTEDGNLEASAGSGVHEEFR